MTKMEVVGVPGVTIVDSPRNVLLGAPVTMVLDTLETTHSARCGLGTRIVATTVTEPPDMLSDMSTGVMWVTVSSVAAAARSDLYWA